jgi:glycosyltransferase involved in cell wall biosynthesis
VIRAPLPPHVSVVTPVHNGAEYLAECMESVLGQTYAHFDYILVDNCSTDGSADIANEYARRDRRIKVVTNPRFLDQMSNINNALRLISPRAAYCKVVFADDAILPTCLEQMVAVAESDPRVAVVSAYETSEQGLSCLGLPFHTSVVEGLEACRFVFLSNQMLFGSLNTLLLRADVARARDPFLVDAHGYFEDIDAIFSILGQHKLGFAHQVLTFTRRANTSTITRIMAWEPFVLMRWMMLHRFGPSCLSAVEFAQCRRELAREYRALLGESFLRRREREFWDFHRRGWEQIGLPWPAATIAWGSVHAALDLALNPKSTMERLWRRWRRRAASRGSVV